MNIKAAIFVVISALSISAHAGFKPSCHDKDKGKKEVVPPPPPTADDAVRVNTFLAQANISNRQLSQEFKRVMGRAGKKMLRDHAKLMKAQGKKKLSKAERQEFMRTALTNWANPPVPPAAAAAAGTGVTFDQYQDANNGTVAVIPPGGDLATGTGTGNQNPPGQGAVGVIIPGGGVQ